MVSYRMDTTKTEAASRREIAEEFRKWNPRYGTPVVETYDFPPPQEVGSAKATVRFVLRGVSIVVECSSQGYYQDNLRCCFYAVHSMRMNEVRGIADTMQKAYLQLAAPSHVDPWEVLGVRPDAEIEIIDAAYKARAKKIHPDHGGSAEAMKALNDAYDRIKKERGAT